MLMSINIYLQRWGGFQNVKNVENGWPPTQNYQNGKYYNRYADYNLSVYDHDMTTGFDEFCSCFVLEFGSNLSQVSQ